MRSPGPSSPRHVGRSPGRHISGPRRLDFDRFEPIRRWYGDDHVVDESILHATAVGASFGLPGRGRRVRACILHVFDFAGEVITRESAWLDVTSIMAQLA